MKVEETDKPTAKDAKEKLREYLIKKEDFGLKMKSSVMDALGEAIAKVGGLKVV